MISVTDEMVEAAADALATRLVNPEFGPTHFQLRMRERDRARVALEAGLAAAPDYRALSEDLYEQLHVEHFREYGHDLYSRRALCPTCVALRNHEAALSAGGGVAGGS